MTRSRKVDAPSADKPAARHTPEEARLVREARRFDLRALVQQLGEIGYSRDEILFESSLESGEGSLVAGVRFREGEMFRTAIITVHLGLLGDAGLLPSYFLRVAEQSPSPERFFDFLRFFDHRMIANLFEALHPEESVWASGTVLESFFRMTAPGSLSTLQWVVQLHFPELGVRVTRRPFEEPVKQHACRTGQSVLDGSAILGPTLISDLDGFDVELISEDEADMRGHDTADLVMERLGKRVLPLLAPFRLPLVVRLTVLFHRSPAHFDEPGDRQFLGYERLLGKRLGEPAAPPAPAPAPANRRRPPPEDPMGIRHTTVMYRGITGETPAP